MSEAYQFAIGRTRAIVLAGCFVAAAALLFFAGAITGILYSDGRAATASAGAASTPIVKPAKLPAVKAPETAAGAALTQAASNGNAQTSGATANAAAVGSAAAAAPPATAPGAAPAAPPQPAPASSQSEEADTSDAAASAPAVKPALPSIQTAAASAEPKPVASPASVPQVKEASYAVPLAVRVGSFTVKSNAETLMQSLRDMGYQPAVSRSTDARGRAWYLVKLGPFTKWDAASKVANRISIAENVSPVIGPMQ